MKEDELQALMAYRLLRAAETLSSRGKRALIHIPSPAPFSTRRWLLSSCCLFLIFRCFDNPHRSRVQ